MTARRSLLILAALLLTGVAVNAAVAAVARAVDPYLEDVPR